MDQNYETVLRIMLATNKIDGVYYLLSKKLGINENTLAFLYALHDGQPHSQKEISNEWLIPRTTINSIVKTMRNEGYVEFCAEPHKKEKALILTEQGRKYADSLLSDIYTVEEKAIIGTLKNYSPEFVLALEDFSNRLHHEFCEVYQPKKEHNKSE